MPSQINTNSIDPTFPIPGVNQPTQGFRSNFLAIQNALVETRNEMNDLINKVVVSAPLTYGANTSINNFGGMINSNLSLMDFAYTSYDYGDISSSSTQIVDFNVAHTHKFNLTVPSVQSINVENFPNMGESEIVISVTANTTPQYVDFSAVTTNSNVYSNFPNANLVITNTNYPYVVKLNSLDGPNWNVKLVSGPSIFYETTPPSSSVGASGDIAGMISYDSSYFYICVGNYDAHTSIWTRTTLSTF